MIQNISFLRSSTSKESWCRQVVTAVCVATQRFDPAPIGGKEQHDHQLGLDTQPSFHHPCLHTTHRMETIVDLDYSYIPTTVWYISENRTTWFLSFSLLPDKCISCVIMESDDTKSKKWPFDIHWVCSIQSQSSLFIINSIFCYDVLRSFFWNNKYGATIENYVESKEKNSANTGLG